uniref:CC-NBS-LRR protein n=1 Tax=Quercus lobata TaxID=97700 RepID=A0A7N2LDP4_QUELO
MKLHDLDALTTLSQELFENNSSFRQLEIVNCPSLSSFPGGLFTKLQDLHIEDCRNLKSLSIPNNLHFDLILLRKMTFKDCPNLEFFPVKGLPTPNLQSLLITNCNNLMPQKEWGLHRMVSLTCFEIEGGCSNLELFPEEGLLPNTLTSLRISRLPHLKFIGQGLHHLTLLGKLEINCCEKLELMPEEGLPASLFYLHIQNWSLLADPCQKDGTKKSPEVIIMYTDLFIIASNDSVALAQRRFRRLLMENHSLNPVTMIDDK